MKYTRFFVSIAILFLALNTAKAQVCITLTSGPQSQVVCNGSPIIDIVYDLGSGVTLGTVTGLPNGVGHTIVGNRVTISGSPNVTVFGNFDYEVTTNGTCTGPPNAKGTITVNSVPPAPTAAPVQTFCAIDNPDVSDLTAAGTGILWYQTASGGSALDPSTLLVSGPYYASQTVNGCESTSRVTVFAVVNNPAPPLAPSPQSFCAVNNPIVGQLVVSASGIQWYIESTGGMPLPSSAFLTTRTYYASQTIDGCESTTRTAVSVIVGDAPPPTGSATQTFCTADNPTVANLQARGTNIRWYLTATGGTSLASSTPISTGTYYASQTPGTCESSTRLAVAVTVDNPPAPTGASPPYFCQINNPTVASLTATGTGIRWYLNASGGTALASTTLLSTRTYYASQTYGSCESTNRLAVSVVVNNPSAPTGTSPQSFCAIDNPTVASLAASGSDLRWYTVASGGTPLPSATPLNNATYYASQTIGGCESASRLAVVVSVGNPAAPTAVSPQIFCAINNPTVANLTATGTSIRWYLTSTGGTALASTTPLVTGTYYASQTVGSCESATRRSVAVTVNDPSAPTGPASQDFCLISNPTVSSLTASGTGIRWYLTATGGTALAPATPLITGTYYATQTVSGCESVTRLMVSVTVSIPSAPTGDAVQVFCSGSNPTVANLTAVGLNILWYLTPTGGTPLSSTTVLVTGNYYASQTIGTCESASRLAVAVTVNQTPVANAGTGGDACGLSFSLNAVTPLAGTGTWSQTTGPGTSVFAPGPGTPNALVTVTAYGTYTFTWTVINNNCVNSATITVNFYQQPLANAGTGGVECDLNFALNAVPGIGVGTWSLVTGTGTASFVPTPNAPDATVIVSDYGTYTFRWTEANGTCTSSAVVTVNFYEQPVADAGPGGDACDLDYQLAAVPSAGVGSWSMIDGTGTALFTPDASSPTALVTVSEYGTKQFRWIETNGICADTAVITVNFNQQPVANAGTGGNNCGLEFNLSAVPSFGVGTWTIESGPGTASYTPNANSPTAEIRVSVYGTYVLRWTEMNGSCSSSATVSVTFISQPSADAGNGGNECDLTFLLNAVPAPSGNGLWSKISGPGNVTFTPDASRHNATVSVTQFGSYDFAWTLNNSECTSSDIIRVTFHDLPQVNAGADAAICEGRTAQLNATGSGTFAWIPAASLSNPAVSNPVASPDATTTYTVTLTDQYGCRNSDEVKVEVRSQPVADAGEDQELDFLFEADLDANEPGESETGAWTILTGEGDFSDVNDPQARVTDLGIEANSFIWTVTNGVCPVASDTVNINVRSLIIPTLITPNLDGNNDFFVIKGIESLGETSLTIFNRWGARVFENKNYDNLWNGVDDKENPLPEDTYFYILNPEKSKTLKGYVVIRR